MSEHTPGPWTVEPWKHYLFSICGPDGVVLGETCMPNSEANARLIAAAPELLAELEAAVKWWDRVDQVDEELIKPVWVEYARKAIAKAKEEA